MIPPRLMNALILLEGDSVKATTLKIQLDVSIISIRGLRPNMKIQRL